MPKICSVVGCEYPSFGRDKNTNEPFCKSHQYKRTDLKPYRYEKKPTGELKVFKEIWEERPRVSFISGESLQRYDGTNKFVSLFAHVLAKGRYPHLRLSKDNVVMLTPHEHYLFDHGTKKQRQDYAKNFLVDWHKIFKLKEELIQKYGKKV